ncbi:lipocalin-like domain-containing protein [Aquiflexum sp.]|uniref:lipocalin-like domain-containing protein n=1 Tax=Aquiflexum sp. TaxID=1872584 RepID=UPI0035943BD3
MQNNFKFLFIICIAASMAFLSSCGKDDDGPAGSPIVGTWTYNAANLTITVNNQPLTTFLVSTGEYTAAEAAAFEAFIKTTILNETDLSGSITFNADGTYRAVDGSDVETGTYTLTNNDTRLSLTSDGDTQIVEVKELTNNRMVLKFSEEEPVDIDDDGVDENVKFDFEFNFVK